MSWLPEVIINRFPRNGIVRWIALAAPLVVVLFATSPAGASKKMRSRALALVLFTLTVFLMLMTPKATTTTGLPWNDAWVAFLLFIIGPASFIAFLVDIEALRRRSILLAAVIALLVYIVGAIFFMVLAVNIGIIYP